MLGAGQRRRGAAIDQACYERLRGPSEAWSGPVLEFLCDTVAEPRSGLWDLGTDCTLRRHSGPVQGVVRRVASLWAAASPLSAAPPGSAFRSEGPLNAPDRGPLNERRRQITPGAAAAPTAPAHLLSPAPINYRPFSRAAHQPAQSICASGCNILSKAAT